jgi:branched-chain amino acid transport system substrate-binding protein
MYPKFGATDFSSEISRLQALKPDVILSTSWGGDLDTLLRQSAQRGLLRGPTWVLPLGESSLERLGRTLPDGLIVGMRGEGYYLHPEHGNDPKHKAFVAKFKARTGQHPIYPVYHAAQAFQGVADAYAAALQKTGGRWPTVEQLAETMRALKFRAMTREVKMREDGQGLADQMLGVTRTVPGQAFPVISGLTIYPAEIVQNPVGTSSPEWVKTLKPALLRDPRIKSY